jgi:hypothetical protein
MEAWRSSLDGGACSAARCCSSATPNFFSWLQQTLG